MNYSIQSSEILETIKMVADQNFDVRTLTIGIDLHDCIHPDMNVLNQNIYNKITHIGKDLVQTARDLSAKYGVPIVNQRISVTPIAQIAAATGADSYVSIAQTLDRAAKAIGVSFIGGFSTLAPKGLTPSGKVLIRSIPEAMATTDIVCSSVNIGSTRAGINMDAVKLMSETIKRTAEITPEGFGCAKIVVFCNAVDDNPFMAGAFHGAGEGGVMLNVGVSGPGVVQAALADCEGKNLTEIAEIVKKTAFKITRVGELIGQEAAKRLGIPFGILDLSLAPTPAVGDSVARILEAMGLSVCGTHGTTAALALLNDAVKKGGDRQELHEKIRQHSMAAGAVVKVEGGKNDLVDRIAADPAFMTTKEEILAILKPANFVGRAPEQTADFLNEVIKPILDKEKDLIGIDVEINV